jgi:hypothetical protein
MDELKLKGKECKVVKSSLLKRVDFDSGNVRFTGNNHIKDEDYGKLIVNNCSTPFTNKYVKKVKDELKRDYRAKKRALKQRLRKEIEAEIHIL